MIWRLQSVARHLGMKSLILLIILGAAFYCYVVTWDNVIPPLNKWSSPDLYCLSQTNRSITYCVLDIQCVNAISDGYTFILFYVYFSTKSVFNFSKTDKIDFLGISKSFRANLWQKRFPFLWLCQNRYIWHLYSIFWFLGKLPR